MASISFKSISVLPCLCAALIFKIHHIIFISWPHTKKIHTIAMHPVVVGQTHDIILSDIVFGVQMLFQPSHKPPGDQYIQWGDTIDL